MTQKHPAAEGIFATAGKAVDESMTMAESIRSGKLTRAEFEAWYAKRTSERETIIVNLRATTGRFLEPLGAAIERGREVLGAASPRPRAARRRRPATRGSSNLSARRK
jgi:hypothetical protein